MLGWISCKVLRNSNNSYTHDSLAGGETCKLYSMSHLYILPSFSQKTIQIRISHLIQILPLEDSLKQKTVKKIPYLL